MVARFKVIIKKVIGREVNQKKFASKFIIDKLINKIHKIYDSILSFISSYILFRVNHQAFLTIFDN